ncbi:MAG: hypothetical protein FWC46_02240, partial [Actinomycetia bacterium]|nr:hypothetical protein [Actinomycetes bacterium]
SPPDAAEANTVAPPAPPPPNPQLTLSKWVCLTGTGCAVPTTPTTAALAADGWVKATTVAYDTAATWLIVITNTGDVPLANVRLSDAVTGDGHGATTAACADGTVITPLLGTGASSVITCTTPEITNTSLIGSGHAVVNTAYATGTPAGDDGTPLPNPDGSAAWTVTSGPDAAEANTRTPPAPPTVNPQLDLSKWVCRTGTGCAVPAVATTSALASAGWVKATTVTYDSDATWLIVVTNDGDTALAHVTLADTITGDGRGETSPECADGTLIAPLLPAGASTVITCTTAQITDTSLIGSGTAVVNTASATGTPAAPDGTPLPNPDGSASWTVVSHPDAAEVNTVAPPPAPVPVHPQVTLSKWVCQGGIGCPVPPEFSAGPATLAADGWVKATTVDYDGIAAWLVAITNTGDVPLLNLTLTDTLTGGGHGIMTAGCDNGMIITPRLNVGASAVITCTTAEITNTAALDSGDAVVNTASVEGTPADADGAPLPNPDGSSTAWTVTSPPDAARVNAAEPAPHMEDVKYDTANGDTITTGDYDGTAKRLAPDVATPISVVVTNDGTESLINLVVKDQTIAGVGVLTGLTCDFSGLGGPATGTTWAGPFRPGESFTCTGTLPALARGQKHSDKVIVIATGDVTGKPVTCEDEWNGNVPVRPDAPTGGTAADDAARASAAGASMLALTLLVLGAWVARRRWSAE